MLYPKQILKLKMGQTVSSFLSEKIKILSFISIILVLYIHSGFHNTSNEILGMSINNILQDTISGGLGQCAVPLFYMISGFLFFQHTESGMPSIIKKIRKRGKTLLIPYLIGCLFFPLTLIIIESIPGSERFMNSTFMKNLYLPLSDILCSTFYKTAEGGSPWAFQLWFLRDLIILVLFSPILFYARKYIKTITIIILFLITYCKSITSIIPVIPCFWFMFGDAIVTHLNKPKSISIICGILFFCGVVLQITYPDNKIILSLEIPIIILGIFFFWNCYDYLTKDSFSLKKHSVLNILTNFTFFIYLFHEPTLNIVRKIIVVIIGKSSIGFAISYLLSPWIFIVAAIAIGLLLKKKCSGIYSILVGGR